MKCAEVAAGGPRVTREAACAVGLERGTTARGATSTAPTPEDAVVRARLAGGAFGQGPRRAPATGRSCEVARVAVRVDCVPSMSGEV